MVGYPFPLPDFHRLSFRQLAWRTPAWSLNRPGRPLVIGVLQPMSLPPSSAPTATGWSDSCRAGFAPAEEWRLVTAHTDLMLTSRAFGSKSACSAAAAGAQSRPNPPRSSTSRASRSTSRRRQGPVGGHQGHTGHQGRSAERVKVGADVRAGVADVEAGQGPWYSWPRRRPPGRSLERRLHDGLGPHGRVAPEQVRGASTAARQDSTR